MLQIPSDLHGQCNFTILRCLKEIWESFVRMADVISRPTHVCWYGTGMLFPWEKRKGSGSEANQSPSSGVHIQSALCYTSDSSNVLTAWFFINCKENATNVSFILSLSTAADKGCPDGHSKRQSCGARKQVKRDIMQT
jgi:hypothetical protein